MQADDYWANFELEFLGSVQWPGWFFIFVVFFGGMCYTYCQPLRMLGGFLNACTGVASARVPTVCRRWCGLCVKEFGFAFEQCTKSTLETLSVLSLTDFFCSYILQRIYTK